MFQIKNKFKDYKCKAKSKLSALHRDTRRTEGGQVASNFSKTEELIATFVGINSVKGVGLVDATNDLSRKYFYIALFIMCLQNI